MSRKKDLSIAFLGTLVPDTIEFHNKAFNRSGNMVQSGLVEGLDKQGLELKILTSQPIPTYPISKTLFCTRKDVNIGQNLKITTIPSPNIVVIRELFRGLYALASLIAWAIKNRNNRRCIIVYNTYSPPLPIVFLIGKITFSKTIAILYDLGMPPKSLKLDPFRKFIYRCVELSAKYFIPRLDGRIVITEEIAHDYAINKHFLMVDGGVSSNIINRLFPLELSPKQSETVFLCAGSLWAGNGTRIILDAMKLNNNPSIKIWFAGSGPDVPLIENASITDSRIEYKGMLNMDQLFQLYKSADVLMNIRVISEEEGKYLFPSKLLEYLTIGKLVISTSSVHIKRDYGHLCVIIDEINPLILCDLLNELSNISNKVQLDIGLTARKEMLKNHTWDQKSIQIVRYISNKVFTKERYV